MHHRIKIYEGHKYAAGLMAGNSYYTRCRNIIGVECTAYLFGAGRPFYVRPRPIASFSLHLKRSWIFQVVC
jgi:hypothetical protein